MGQCIAMKTVMIPQAALPAASTKVARTPTRIQPSASKRLVCRAANPEAKTEVVFEPFQAVKGELTTVENLDNTHQSFARLDYHEECEAAINEQINIEYNISYVYHALHSFFDRDNVGMPGLAKYFKDGSDEERDHAQLLITCQHNDAHMADFIEGELLQ